ncbi:MAG TPA: peptidylprolyl isomerase [Opitutaceae bacterium]|nr:peptidylprolyl isomerase [Opitutaceae bacterium]
MSRSVVSFHYSLRNQQGQLLDASIGGEPILYLEGSGQIIDGLEEALSGLPAGTKRVIMVAAEKAYGQRDPELIRKVARNRLPVEKLNIGDMFQTDGDRHAAIVTVVAIEGEEVTLDGNHPLAGQDLVFDVEVLNVRPATQDELDHGHAHGHGGHHHHGHEHGEGCCGRHDHSDGQTHEDCCGGHAHDHDHGHEHGHGGCGCGGKH